MRMKRKRCARLHFVFCPSLHWPTRRMKRNGWWFIPRIRKKSISRLWRNLSGAPGVWVQVVSGGTTELLERIAEEAETPVADVMFGGGVESLLAYEDYFMPCDAPRDAMLAECRFENHRFVAFSRRRWRLSTIRGW